MEHTTVSISLDRESLQQAVTYILEYLATTPPDMGQMDIGEQIVYHSGVAALCDCLRSTF